MQSSERFDGKTDDTPEEQLPEVPSIGVIRRGKRWVVVSLVTQGKQVLDVACITPDAEPEDAAVAFARAAAELGAWLLTTGGQKQ